MILYRDADLYIDYIPYQDQTDHHKKLYPLLVDTFRAVVVQPKTKFRVWDIFGRRDYQFFCGFLAYFLFHLIVGRFLFVDPRHRPGFFELTYSIFCETLGQRRHRTSPFVSVNFVTGFYCYFIYFWHIVATGYIIASMTNSRNEMHMQRLRMIKECDMDVVVTTQFNQQYPQGSSLVEHYLRKPIVLTTRGLHWKLKNDEKDFVVVFNDNAVRTFLANYLQERKWYLVKETFGELTWSLRNQIPNLIYPAFAQESRFTASL